MPFPVARKARTFFSTLSHKLRSGSFPVNNGVGKRRNVRFSDSSAALLGDDVESIVTVPTSIRLWQKTRGRVLGGPQSVASAFTARRPRGRIKPSRPLAVK